MDCQYFFDARQATQMFYGCGSFVSYGPPRPETEEECQVREEQARLFAQRQEESRGAEERAETLLKQRLGGWTYRRFGWNGQLMRPSMLWRGTRYLIRKDAKIQVVKNGRVQTELCVVAKAGEPEADRLMTILDLIESGKEEQLWEMANVIPQDR